MLLCMKVQCKQLFFQILCSFHEAIHIKPYLFDYMTLYSGEECMFPSFSLSYIKLVSCSQKRIIPMNFNIIVSNSKVNIWCSPTLEVPKIYRKKILKQFFSIFIFLSKSQYHLWVGCVLELINISLVFYRSCIY